MDTGIRRFHTQTIVVESTIVLHERCEENGCTLHHYFVMDGWKYKDLMRDEELLPLEPGKLYRVTNVM